MYSNQARPKKPARGRDPPCLHPLFSCRNTCCTPLNRRIVKVWPKMDEGDSDNSELERVAKGTEPNNIPVGGFALYTYFVSYTSVRFLYFPSIKMLCRTHTAQVYSRLTDICRFRIYGPAIDGHARRDLGAIRVAQQSSFCSNFTSRLRFSLLLSEYRVQSAIEVTTKYTRVRSSTPE